MPRVAIKDMFDQCYIVDPVTGCYNWTRAKCSSGQGRLYVDGRVVVAMRFTWEQSHGKKIPKNVMLSHSCDNSGCVNPAHAIPASRYQLGMKARTKPATKGALKHAKLTAATAAEIIASKKAGGNSKELAAEHGVSVSTINRVAAGRTWLC